MSDDRLGVILITILGIAAIVSGTIIELRRAQSSSPPCTQDSSSPK